MVAGPLTGAAILAARGALRVGAGLVSIACLSKSASIFATAVPSAMVRPIDDEVEKLWQGFTRHAS